MIGYGIVKLKDSKDGYRVKVPKADGGYHQKQFVESKFNHPRAAAILWRDKAGREEWGSYRWDMILNTGNARRFRSLNHSVFVYKYDDCGWIVWRVDWREEGKNRAKIFGSRRYGSLDAAGEEAQIFASKKRAELTGGSLHLSENILNEIREKQEG